MPGFAIPVSVAVQRRNPVRIPRRDLVVAGGDTPTLAFTIYQTEADAAPMDVTDAILTLSLVQVPDGGEWPWDYGFAHDFSPWQVGQFVGAPVDPANGRIDIAIDGRFMQQVWTCGQRFWFFVTLAFPIGAQTGIGIAGDALGYRQGAMTILGGAIDFTRAPYVPLTQTPELLSGIGIAP